jgi:CubicO group peptidase (beta-lactamase class C family)
MTMNHLPGKSDLSSHVQVAVQRDPERRRRLRPGLRGHPGRRQDDDPRLGGEYYWGGMFTTSFFVDPVEKLHVVFMTQLSPSMLYPIRRELKTLIYSSLT